MMKRWKIAEAPVEALAFPLAAELHPIARVLFAQRQVNDAGQAEGFLQPDWQTGIHDPFAFARMKEVVARVFEALERGERITVHGDYDADGVTGSTVVISTLREIERQMGIISTRVDFYIPHRDKEGYGLHRPTVDLLRERGTSLIITVDCGIACVDEIAYAKEQGMDTIVLDHHQFGETLPDAFLIHPRLPGESYPFEHLAAVGVAWKFACAMIETGRTRGLGISIGWEKWLLDLVSIATVTDMVPLIGENRVLMTYGLTVLNKSRRPGLRHLIEASGREFGSLGTEDIGFSLGPRINAAGRMDHAELALRLMIAETDEEASELAGEVEKRNRERQKAVERMMAKAEELFLTQQDGAIVVLWDHEWSPSLVGLIAGRFMERTGKPCVAIGKHGEHWIGSGRSLAAYDITAAVQRAGEGILTRSGGHVQACGFSFLRDEDAARFSDALHADAAQRLSIEDLVPELSVDAQLCLEDLDWRLIDTLKRFEPYGIGNTRPVFMSARVTVVDVGTVGTQANHVRCTLRSASGRSQKFIGFKFGPRLEEFALGSCVDVVYDVGVNEWNGRREIQCKLIDIRKAV